MRPQFLILGLALAIAIIAGINYFPEEWLGGDTVPDDAIVTDEATPDGMPSQATLDEQSLENHMPETPAMPDMPPTEPPLPPLDGSDNFVRTELASLLPPDWLALDDLVRRVAVVIDNAARGQYPRRQLDFMAPRGTFAVETVGSGDERRYFTDASAYSRYDRYVTLMSSVEPEMAARLLERLGPLLGEALGELGNRESAGAQIQSAILQIEALPALPERVELERPKVVYIYADSQLEALTPLQKQVLRMGPANVARIKAWLAELSLHLVQ